MNSIVRMGHVYEWFLRIGHLGREFRVEISCRHPFLVFAWQHDHVADGAVGHKHCCGSSVGYLGGLICFLKASSAERAYIAPKNHSSPRRGPACIISHYSLEAEFTASVVGGFAPVATETPFMSTNGKHRLQEIMLKFPRGSAVDLAYERRNTIGGGVTLESWLRACQWPI